MSTLERWPSTERIVQLNSDYMCSIRHLCSFRRKTSSIQSDERSAVCMLSPVRLYYSTNLANARLHRRWSSLCSRSLHNKSRSLHDTWAVRRSSYRTSCSWLHPIASLSVQSYLWNYRSPVFYRRTNKFRWSKNQGTRK